jgi:hypothetical protein
VLTHGQELDAMIERSNSVLRRVQQETDQLLRPTPPPAASAARVVDANADSLKRLTDAIQNGVGV